MLFSTKSVLPLVAIAILLLATASVAEQEPVDTTEFAKVVYEKCFMEGCMNVADKMLQKEQATVPSRQDLLRSVSDFIQDHLKEMDAGEEKESAEPKDVVPEQGSSEMDESVSADKAVVEESASDEKVPEAASVQETVSAEETQ